MNKKNFKSAWWLPNSHLQTIWPVLCRRPIKLETQRERLELPDGDFIDLDWVASKNKTGPLLVMLHGLEGNIESHYARGMLKTISDLGWRGVFMHFRGCSGEPNRLPRNYHSGETNDLQYVIDELRNREPGITLGAIGFSLGGNVLLKWLGETGNKNPLEAAIAISVPFELKKAATRIQQGFSKFYQWYFIRCLRERLAKKLDAVSVPLDASIIYKVSSMLEFDDKFTAPLHGFRDAEDYYKKASSRQFLRHITVPTLILHAKDDPFMSEDSIPEPHELSSAVDLHISENGGHVGFVTGKYPWRPVYWLEEQVSEFLREHVKKSPK